MTLQEQHNNLQRVLAIKYLGLYNRKLMTQAPHIPNNALLTSLEKLITQGQDLKRFSTLHREAVRVRRIVEEESNDTIEIILNTNGKYTEIILPIKTDDLSSGTTTLPVDVLYAHCVNVSDHYNADEEGLFEGYLVLRMEGEVDKRNVAGKIVSNAPKDFGGSTIEKGEYKLRVASNFVFTYTDSVQVEEKKIVDKREDRVKGSKGISPEVFLKRHASIRTKLTKEEAIWYLNEGITSLQLRTSFSDTNAMSIAGWASAHTKGYYESCPIDSYKPRIK